jgi:GntR family transcriptional regulator
VRPATASEAATLGIHQGRSVVVLRRLRLGDDEPIALESTVLVGTTADAVLAADLETGSLHETLGRAGFVLYRGTGTISAAAATSDDAALLGIAVGEPLLVERRVITDGYGRRIEATESRYVAGRYGLDVQFDVELPDDDAAPSPG